jgi:hypothetical protein
MSTLTPEQSFQEKVKARIRESIGDLMPDEMLQQLVSRAVEDAFFKRIETSNYYGRQEHRDPWLTLFVREQLEKQVQSAVEAWMGANADKITTLIQQTLDGGILTCIARAVSRQFESPMNDLEEKLGGVIATLGGLRNG